MNAPSAADRIRRLRAIARLFDEAIPLPGGFRIGLDPLIGLIPGFGDAISAAFALFIIVEGRRLGATPSVMLRMLGNTVIDAAVGSIPVAGDVFDAFYKANRRNIDLLEQFHVDPVSAHRASKQRVTAVSILLALVVLAILALPIVLIVVVVRMF